MAREPKDGWERNGFTAVANVLTSMGFALALWSIYALRNHVVTWHEGLLWGLPGFWFSRLRRASVFRPSFPEFRLRRLGHGRSGGSQLRLLRRWGLVSFVLKRSPWASVLGLTLIALPHLIGAPHLEEVVTNVLEPLSHQFIVAVTLTSLMSWALLGSFTAVV